jgi:hypothetical protein
MSRKDCFVLVTRALAFIQLITALLEITYLPERLLLVQLHFRTHGALNTYDPLFAPDLISALVLLIRIGILLLAALLLLRGGPKIQAWFFPETSPSGHTQVE